MPFYIIRQYTLIEGSASIDGIPGNIDPSEWIKGKFVSDPRNSEKLELLLALESGDYRGDIIDGFLTLYSDELKDALDSIGVDNIDYFPVVLRDQNTNELEGGFWLVNIIGLLDCIDMNRSKIKYWPSGRGFDFESMVIDEAKTNGAKIFRLKEDPTIVIITEDLKLHLEERDTLYGVELIQTEDYSDW